MNNITYQKQLLIDNKIELLEPFIGAKKHHKMRCCVCSHIWSATPLSKRQTFKLRKLSGCPNCNTINKKQLLATKHAATIKDLSLRGISIIGTYSGLRSTTKKVTFFNRNCGHTFTRYPGYVISGETDCTICGKQKRTKTITHWSKQNSLKWQQTATDWKIYKAKVTNITEKNYKDHKNIINPHDYTRGLAGTPSAYQLDHKVPKRFCYDNEIPAEICADVTNLQMLPWEQNASARNTIKGQLPIIFSSYIDDSTRTQQYIDIIQQTVGGFESYCMVGQAMATLFNKDLNIAILIIPITQTYANQKIGIKTYNSWKDMNITSFVIFEDEMRDNIDIIISKIQHYTLINNCTRIHGRQCIVEKISPRDKSEFLQNNHIQGNDNSIIHYGAFNMDGILVAVMTFAHPRISAGYSQSNDQYWELSRFATSLEYRIPGIASKLLKHFTNNHAWDAIISYADIRWGFGNLYKQLHFELVVVNPPSYKYIIDGIRKHRWNYRKDIIKKVLTTYDPALTEYQNMEIAGYWRVWDCGTARYILTNNQSNYNQ